MCLTGLMVISVSDGKSFISIMIEVREKKFRLIRISSMNFGILYRLLSISIDLYNVFEKNCPEGKTFTLNYLILRTCSNRK